MTQTHEDYKQQVMELASKILIANVSPSTENQHTGINERYESEFQKIVEKSVKVSIMLIDEINDKTRKQIS